MAENNVPKVFHDPGWNDPPVFSYESHVNYRNKKSSLNKRLNYSSSGTNDCLKSAMNVGSDEKVAPPLGSNLTPGASVVKQILNPDNKPCETVELTVVLRNLQLIMKELYQNENEREVCEIKRRLGLMEKMWIDEKFPGDVKQKLCSISEALRDNDLIACDNLQRSLMVDYTSLCSPWMAAVRMLINSKRRTFHDEICEH